MGQMTLIKPIIEKPCVSPLAFYELLRYVWSLGKKKKKKKKTPQITVLLKPWRNWGGGVGFLTDESFCHILKAQPLRSNLLSLDKCNRNS